MWWAAKFSNFLSFKWHNGCKLWQIISTLHWQSNSMFFHFTEKKVTTKTSHFTLFQYEENRFELTAVSFKFTVKQICLEPEVLIWSNTDKWRYTKLISVGPNRGRENQLQFVAPFLLKKFGCMLPGKNGNLKVPFFFSGYVFPSKCWFFHIERMCWLLLAS